MATPKPHSIKHLRNAGLLLAGIIATGIIGYMVIEGLTLLDAIYMTVITIGTVGFSEVHTLSPLGKIFTIALIGSGVSAAAYAIGRFLEFLLEGYFSEVMGGRSMKKRIDQLSNHYIICGFGRVGEQVAREFKRAGAPFVVLDPNPDIKKYLDAEEVLYIQGDAADEQVLRDAGIDKAKGLVSVVDSDADNVYVTLTARALNPGLFIITRANLENSAYKLKRAGANRVISPYSLGGRRIASMVLKPVVSDFLDTVMHGEKMEFQLEEMTIGKGSPLKDATVREADVRKKSGAMVISIYRADGHFENDLHGDTRISEGDRLIVIGTPEQLEKLEDMNKHGL
jgi:voltage-gated potassium channel